MHYAHANQQQEEKRDGDALSPAARLAAPGGGRGLLVARHEVALALRPHFGVIRRGSRRFGGPLLLFLRLARALLGLGSATLFLFLQPLALALLLLAKLGLLARLPLRLLGLAALLVGLRLALGFLARTALLDFARQRNRGFALLAHLFLLLLALLLVARAEGLQVGEQRVGERAARGIGRHRRDIGGALRLRLVFRLGLRARLPLGRGGARCLHHFLLLAAPALLFELAALLLEPA